MKKNRFWLGLCLLYICIGTASADLIEIGTGVNDATVYIEWEDSFHVTFLVHSGVLESETLTGLELLDILEAETELSTVRTDSGLGAFVDEIRFEGHVSGGYGGGDLWWHYWLGDMRDHAAWQSAGTVAGGRILGHGESDGWIYGRGDAPLRVQEIPFLDRYRNYVYDANDFATTWIDYRPTATYFDWISGDPFDDPAAALGRPTVDTTGASWLPEGAPLPVVPVFPPFRHFESVFLGERGSVTLAFNHPVADDEYNPYGLDVIVFGDAYQVIGAGESWHNGDPAQTVVSPMGGREPGVVSVSQDGVTWYSFTRDPNLLPENSDFIPLPPEEVDGPFADGFAPTLGRVYDPTRPDVTLGEWNQWWAEPTNPTLPLDPTLNYASFGGRSVARIAEMYGDSAGGTGFDIGRLDLPADPNSGKKWFTLIRIDDAPGGGHTEVDAVADVSAPGDYRHPDPRSDVVVEVRDRQLNYR